MAGNKKDEIVFEEALRLEIPGFEYWRIKKRKKRKLRLTLLRLFCILIIIEVAYLNDNIELGPNRISVKEVNNSGNIIEVTLKSNVTSSPYYKTARLKWNGDSVNIIPIGSKNIFRSDNMIRLELKGEEGREHIHKINIDKKKVNEIKIYGKVIWSK